MADKPYLTVVLFASRHPELVGAAIDSVRAQSMPPRSTELLVVRDYDDPKLEAQMREAGARSLRVDPTQFGPAVGAAIEESRGEVLAFLDDDDRFAPGKLGGVTELFSSGRLGFCHNGYSLIDSNGAPLPDHPFRREERRRRRDLGVRVLSPPDLVAQLRRLPALGLDFNSSCMSIRRDVALAFAARLDLPRVRTPDALLYFAALASGRPIRVDPRLWTEYRIHPRNSSAGGTVTDPLADRLRFALRVQDSYDEFVRALRSGGEPWVADEAEGLRAQQRAYVLLRTPGTPRRVYRETARTLRQWGETYPLRSDPRLRRAVRLFEWAPGLGRWLYRREAVRASRASGAT